MMTSISTSHYHPHQEKKLAPGGGRPAVGSSRHLGNISTEALDKQNSNGNGKHSPAHSARRGRQERKQAKSLSPSRTLLQHLGDGGDEGDPVARNAVAKKKGNQKGKAKSKSPTPANRHKRNNSPPRNHGPADISVIVNRVDVFDGAVASMLANDQAGFELRRYSDGETEIPPVSQYAYQSPRTVIGDGAASEYYSCVSDEDQIAMIDLTEGSFMPSEALHSSPIGQERPSTPTREGRKKKTRKPTVAVVKAPQAGVTYPYSGGHPEALSDPVMDTDVPNPHPSVVHDKYWAQRRRLFSRFDRGIELDAQGWYSVTPEAIADHVADQLSVLAQRIVRERRWEDLLIAPGKIWKDQGIILLDAFCGCGGNTIAFGKLPSSVVSLVVCMDIDRTKLRKAARNAAIYDIPKDKLLFVECSSLYVMDRCYEDGNLILHHSHNDEDNNDSAMPKAPRSRLEECAGFTIGGVDLLPPHIDAVFMDPPWGGVDYETLGKQGYDLTKHMKIRYGGCPGVGPSVYSRRKAEELAAAATWAGAEDPVQPTHVSASYDAFFDPACIAGGPSGFAAPHTMAAQQRKVEEAEVDGKDEYVDGVELVKMAASATRSRIVVYDLPRNTNKASLGRAALAAGYRGNIKLDEHYLNGRLKTATAYMGTDHRDILAAMSLHRQESSDT